MHKISCVRLCVLPIENIVYKIYNIIKLKESEVKQ